MTKRKKTDQNPNAEADRTPLEMRRPLVEAMLAHVAFDGWTQTALQQAAEDLKLSHGFAELAFPDGAEGVLKEHLLMADEAMAHALAALDLPSMRIRDRITTAIRTRLEQAEPYREAVRKGLAFLLRPDQIAAGSGALWRTCDAMWRAAGDTSTDHNYYTKRLTLAGVYSSCLLYWLNDESDNYADTWAFLDRRIENVMQFEKAKFEFREMRTKLPSLSRFLNRLRYPG